MATIFDGLVKNENQCTTLLRNIMARHSTVAAATLSVLLHCEISDTVAADFDYRTQPSFIGADGREIPDLIVEQEGFRCLIEAKIDPRLELSEAQKKGYPGCFDCEGKRYLCFLVPNDWRHRAKAEEARAAVPPSVEVHIADWQQLVERLEVLASSLADDVLIEAVAYFKWRFKVEPMSPVERETLKDWQGSEYDAIRKLEKTISQARDRFDTLNQEGYATEFERADIDACGFYIKRKGKYLLWVGIWSKSPTPLSFGYHCTGAGWLRPTNCPPNSKTVKDHYLWSLGEDTWDNPDLIQEVVKAFLDKHYSF